jgi:hypothetical protein
VLADQLVAEDATVPDASRWPMSERGRRVRTTTLPAAVTPNDDRNTIDPADNHRREFSDETGRRHVPTVSVACCRSPRELTSAHGTGELPVE